jgi:thioredoxin reductase (NADPH)
MPQNLGQKTDQDGESLDIKDVAINGAGPVGLFAIFECGMVGLNCHVIDALPEVGGQCSALYPEKPIYDIPAYPEISAQDLISNLESQAEAFTPKYHLNQQIVSIRRNSSLWHLKTSLGTELLAKSIIIAGGAGAFGPNKPPLEDIESYEGVSVFYMVRKKADFEGKNIVIAGGGDSAVDWALSLAPLAKSVHLVHRRDKFRAAPESVAKLKDMVEKGDIEMITPYQLESLEGHKGQISTVNVADMKGNIRTLEADILLPFYGLTMELGPIADWELDLNHHQINVHPTTCQTNQEMIYAIGDIAAYENKLKLILIGFSECAFAAHDIYKKINPDTPLHFEYSTTKGLPE